jgi:hypothetical protein
MRESFSGAKARGESEKGVGVWVVGTRVFGVVELGSRADFSVLVGWMASIVIVLVACGSDVGEFVGVILAQDASENKVTAITTAKSFEGFILTPLLQ